MNESYTTEAGLATSREHTRELATSGEVVISLVSEEIGPSTEATELRVGSPETNEVSAIHDPLFQDPTPLPDLTEQPFDVENVLPDQHIALVVPDSRPAQSVAAPAGHERIDGIVAHAQGLELAIQDGGRRNLELAA